MTYGLSSDAREIIAAHQSRNRRQAERIALLEGLVQSTNAERDMYAEHAAAFEAERDQARAIAIDLEQRLAAVMRQLELHIESRRDDHKRHPGDLNSMGVTVAQDALAWAETGDCPVCQDDLAEEAAF